ncbi:MAG: benzoate/H(+) symporter BenE family transporter [Chromatiales bacterium]|jgi:benzoate membrane transport protein|nr:benzoate/H(+) symporter BenE family transporter [Chromatiales bacterium]
MTRTISTQAVTNGLLASFVGFASSFAVVLHGLSSAGANDQQAASGLLAVSVGAGLCAITLSLSSRLPVSIAWSTPGAALLVSTGQLEGGFSSAIGGFLLCGCLFVLAGLWKPLERAVAAIPRHLANAMLAGVLVGLCLAPFEAIGTLPHLALPIVATWMVTIVVLRQWAVPMALAAFVAVVIWGIGLPPNLGEALQSALVPPLEFVLPTFSVTAALSISIPLFLVTMASQNIAGIAVMQSFDYPTRPGRWIATTGIFSLMAAPFGGHAVNMAAITAAMCAGEDAHPDKSRRYWAAVFMGIGMVAIGLVSGLVITFVLIAPPLLIQAVAGLALIGAFSSAALAAFEAPETRESAAVTFLFAASGISIFGVSGAFWGLIAGAALGWGKRCVQERLSD